MLNEENLINQLNRFDTDERFAREKCELPGEGELTNNDKYYFQRTAPEVRKEIVNRLNKIKNWNKEKESGVPRRFSEASFFNYKYSNEREENILKTVIGFVEKKDNEGVLLLTGSKGNGKTHLGVAAVRDRMGFYVGMEDLIYKVESSLNFKSKQTEEEVFEDFTTKEFLVIDEIGRSLKREKEIEILSYILRKRYDNCLPTVIISNLEKKVLLKNLGEAIVDRFCETATSVEFTGESYRLRMRCTRAPLPSDGGEEKQARDRQMAV